MHERGDVNELHDSGEGVRIGAFVAARFRRKHDEDGAEPFAAAFNDVLDCHVDKTILACRLFGEFRLNGTKVIGYELDNLIKMWHF